MVGTGLAPGAVGLHVASGVQLLHPEEQLFAAMLDGWRNQQLARNLSFSSISNRERAVRALAGHAQAFPWLWAPQMVDEWMGDMRSIRGVLQLPAPVIADALGYHPTSATRIAAEAGRPWSGYAARDHSRGPNPRT